MTPLVRQLSPRVVRDQGTSFATLCASTISIRPVTLTSDSAVDAGRPPQNPKITSQKWRDQLPFWALRNLKRFLSCFLTCNGFIITSATGEINYFLHNIKFLTDTSGYPEKQEQKSGASQAHYDSQEKTSTSWALTTNNSKRTNNLKPPNAAQAALLPIFPPGKKEGAFGCLKLFW